MECTIASRPTGHDGLRFALMSAGLRMMDAAQEPDGFPQAHDEVVRFCATELLPHLGHDDRWLVEVADCPEGRLLVEAMRAEVRMMKAAVNELSTATEPAEAMAQVRVLHAFLAAHDHHEALLRNAAAHVGAPAARH